MAAMSHNGLIVLQMKGLEPVVREMMGRFNVARPGPKRIGGKHTSGMSASRTPSPPVSTEAAERAMHDHFSAADAAIAEIFGRPLSVREAKNRRKDL